MRALERAMRKVDDAEEAEPSEEELLDVAASDESRCICKHSEHGRCRRARFHKRWHIGASGARLG